MHLKKLNVKNPVEFIYVLWKICGLIPPKYPSNNRKLYICYSVLANGVSTIFFPITLLVQLVYSTNFQEFCEFGYMALLVVVLNVKFVCTFFVFHKLKNVLKDVDRLTERSKAEEQMTAIESYLSLGHKFSLGILVLLISSGCLILVIAALCLGFEPIPTWFPVDYKRDSSTFLCFHSFEFFCIAFHCFNFTATNCLVVVHICFYLGHTKSLTMRVRQVGTLARTDEKEQELKECVKDHQMLIEYLIFKMHTFF